MKEILFLVEDSLDGGYTARALGESIFTEANDRESLYRNILDAVRCHFDKTVTPCFIRIYFVREEVITT